MTTMTSKPAWTVIVPGARPFTMAGTPCTKAEALVSARLIWPMAEVV